MQGVKLKEISAKAAGKTKDRFSKGRKGFSRKGFGPSGDDG